MRYAIITGSAVTNVIESNDDPADLAGYYAPDLVVANAAANIGDSYVDGQFIPPPAPPLPIPEFARSGDFFHALIDLGWYDQIDGVINAMVQANHPQAKLAKVLWDKASRFERYHPLLIQVAQAASLTDENLDTVFRKTRDYN